MSSSWQALKEGISHNALALIALLTLSVGVIGWYAGAQSTTSARIRVVETSTQLNANDIQTVCTDLDRIEESTNKQLATMSDNFDTRLKSVERTLGLILGAVTDKKLEEDQ